MGIIGALKEDLNIMNIINLKQWLVIMMKENLLLLTLH